MTELLFQSLRPRFDFRLGLGVEGLARFPVDFGILSFKIAICLVDAAAA